MPLADLIPYYCISFTKVDWQGSNNDRKPEEDCTVWGYIKTFDEDLLPLILVK
jgi:hypothetical protein